MTKTIDDYMNDPDIVNEPSALREVHAIRLKIYDETKGMSVAEHTAYYNASSKRFFDQEEYNSAVALKEN